MTGETPEQLNLTPASNPYLEPVFARGKVCHHPDWDVKIQMVEGGYAFLFWLGDIDLGQAPAAVSCQVWFPELRGRQAGLHPRNADTDRLSERDSGGL
jgi:hypothetical protein